MLPKATFQCYTLRIKARNRLACIVRAKCSLSGNELGKRLGRRVASGGLRAGQCPFISRFVECQNTSFIYRRLAFFQDAASSADEKRVYYAIRLEVTRSEGGSPLSMNPMRGGGPAAVCTREHKADFQWFTSSHQTYRAHRRENAFGRRFPFIRAVFMPGPISFMLSQGWGNVSLDETENILSNIVSRIPNVYVLNSIVFQSSDFSMNLLTIEYLWR